MKRVVLSIIASLSIFVSSPEARADEGAEDVQARQLFKEGIRLFKEGEFEDASIAFNRAYELRPSYKILFNVGQVESELKHYCRALKAYSDYLETGGDEIDDARRAEVTEHIRRLEILVGSVEIRYQEDGVTVLIDEERYGATPLASEICVDMGNHDLSLRKGVEEIYRESFRIAGGQHLTLNLEAEKSAAEAPPPPAEAAVAEPETVPEEPAAQAAPEAVPEETPEAAPDAPGAKRKWTWVALGAGAALAAAGGIIGGISMAKEKDLSGRCDGTACDRDDEQLGTKIKNMNLAADILYGSAAACGISALVLFFVEPKRAEERRVGAAPAFSPGGAAVTVSGRF